LIGTGVWPYAAVPMSSATAPAATAKHALRQFGLAIRSNLRPRRCFFLNQPRFAPVVPVPE
jgi:hypothetical protein